MSNAPIAVADQNWRQRRSSRNTDTLIFVTMQGFSFCCVRYAHRRTGRGAGGGSCPPPQFGQFADMNSGRESTLFGQNTIYV